MPRHRCRAEGSFRRWRASAAWRWCTSTGGYASIGTVLRVRYTAWDGSQEVRLSADQVFERLSEYLSFTDDVQQAMDWLLHQGLEWQGVRVMGLDDFL